MYQFLSTQRENDACFLSNWKNFGRVWDLHFVYESIIILFVFFKYHTDYSYNHTLFDSTPTEMSLCMWNAHHLKQLPQSSFFFKLKAPLPGNFIRKYEMRWLHILNIFLWKPLKRKNSNIFLRKKNILKDLKVVQRYFF